MNFEHLFDKKNNKRPCEADQGNGCYWIPTGNIRSMIGDNVNVSLYCKNCFRREEVFLTSEQFKKQENLINMEINKGANHVQARK